jgi:hypothetical protein
MLEATLDRIIDFDVNKLKMCRRKCSEISISTLMAIFTFLRSWNRLETFLEPDIGKVI